MRHPFEEAEIQDAVLALGQLLSAGATDAGRYSLDHSIGWHLSGLGWGLAASVLGIAAGLAMVGWQRAQAGGAHIPETELRRPSRAA